MNKPVRDRIAHEIGRYIRTGEECLYYYEEGTNPFYARECDDVAGRLKVVADSARCYLWVDLAHEADYDDEDRAITRALVQEGVIMSLEVFFYEQDRT